MSLRILILSRNRFLYSTRRLLKAARARGHDAQIVNPLALDIILGTEPAIHYEGEPLEVDAVIPRIGPAISEYGLTVARQFELLGIPVLNRGAAIALARDKIQSLQRLLGAGIPVPPSVVTHAADQVDQAIETVGGLPVIVKTLQGLQGVGVMIFDTALSARSVLDTMWNMGQSMIIQKFFAESAGQDLRVIVIGGKAVTAMRRRSKDGDFRANIHRGGHGEKVALSSECATLATQTAVALGLDMAGVDFLETRDGPVVIEANATPGLEGIEATTDLDLGQTIIQSVEEAVARSRNGAECNSSV